MSYYEILNVSKNATSSEIKKSYYNLAKIYHPDKNKSPEAETKFKEIKDAYETLSDENKRAMYNLTQNMNKSGINIDCTNFFGFDIFNDIDIDIMFTDINEIIKEKQKIFKTYPSEPPMINAPNTYINCYASLEDIYMGTIKEVELEQISPYNKEIKKYYLALNRFEHIFPKEGNYTCVNEKPGDLIFNIFEKKHDNLSFKKINNIDLLYVHSIQLDDFIKQESIIITLPDKKKIRLTINCQQFHIVENKGFLKEDGITRGKLYIYFQIQFNNHKIKHCITNLIA